MCPSWTQTIPWRVSRIKQMRKEADDGLGRKKKLLHWKTERIIEAAKDGPGKSLSLFGLGTDLKVVDVKPTNISVVQARELWMDNVFELEDGSVAILDYESEYKKENFTKYGRYMIDVIDRYLREGREPDIHMLVLYTADIERAKTGMRRTALSELTP